MSQGGAGAGGAALCALALLLLAVVPQTAMARGGPAGFFGIVANGPLVSADFPKMHRGGVGTLRFLLSWRSVHSTPGSLDWSQVDPIVENAAANDIRLLPFVFGSPTWIGEEAHAPLSSTDERRAWREFLTAAVKRYGRGGSFWDGRPVRRPITAWQIWNEPNYPLYWKPEPSPRRYAELVKLSARTIRAVDSRARIVLAGVASVRTGPSPWSFLRDFYRTRQIKRHFDQVAIHPYSPNLEGVDYQLAKIRSAMQRAGDRRASIAVTEIGWASDGPRQSSLVKTPRGQARMLERAFRLLSRKRGVYGIESVLWLSLQDAAESEPGCGFCRHTGLFTIGRDAKPAWRAYKTAARR